MFFDVLSNRAVPAPPRRVSSLEDEEEEKTPMSNSYDESPPYLLLGSSSSVSAKKKKKKKRLMNSLSCATFGDIYSATSQVLGEGSYGKVVTCINNFTEREYAVKIISKNSWYYSRQKVLKEVELYYLCQGQPEIIQLVEYFEEENNFYLIFEKAYGGQLLDHIQHNVKFDEPTAKEIIRDLAVALRFLHDKGIAHRDIKPENILCLNRNNPLPIKLCDFDLCSSVHTTVTTPRLSSPVGSAEYMAPEVVQAFGGRDDYFDDDDEVVELTYDKRCDMWSLGVMMYILLCGYMPFAGHCENPDCRWDVGGECLECQSKLFNSIKNGLLVFPSNDPTWSTVSVEAKDLISKLLVKNPFHRLDAADVLQHPWILSENHTQSSSSSSSSDITSTEMQPTKFFNFSKKTFSQNPTFIRPTTKHMKRQTSMIFPEEFDYKSHQLL